MQVISDAKELEKHTYIKTRNPNIFPKKERLGLAQRMMNEASDLVADLMEANDLLLTDPQEPGAAIPGATLGPAQLPEADPPHRASPTRSSAGSATTPLHTGRGWRPASKTRPPNGTNPIKKGPPRWTRRRVTNRQPWGTPCFFVPGRPTTPATSIPTAR